MSTPEKIFLVLAAVSAGLLATSYFKSSTSETESQAADSRYQIVQPIYIDNRRSTSRGSNSSSSSSDVPQHIVKKKLPGQHGLPPEIIKGIRKFVLFVGRARSGSSILGTLLDAHPHVIVSNELGLKFLEKPWSKTSLFNDLYSESVHDFHGSRRDTGKGYSLGVKGLWQGRYDDYIEVIGDKCAGAVLGLYLADKEKFVKYYYHLQQKLLVPILFIVPLRNPFDIIATRALSAKIQGSYAKLKRLNATKKVSLDSQTMLRNINFALDYFDSREEMIDLIGRDNVLDVHNCDLVNDPRGSIARIFEFLEVEISENYLDVCSAKVFKSVSRSRDVLEWTPEQIETVEKRMKKHKVLDRYSFTSD